MTTREQQLKAELAWKCSILKELLKDEEACRRYEIGSRINRLAQEEPTVFRDLRGITRYAR